MSRILVVDDERHIVRLLSVNLEALGYQIDSAYDGKVALATALGQPPDLIITNIVMPYIDGLEFLAKLRAEPATASIPAIIMSAGQPPDTPAKAKRLGAVYIEKPFAMSEMIYWVRHALDEPNPKSPPFRCVRVPQAA